MVDYDVRQRLVSALILSRIDYCNVVFAALPSVTLALLRRVRFVAVLGPRDHASEAQRELHCLPIEQRITYKLGVIMHSIETGIAPEYISDMVIPVTDRFLL